VTFWDPRLSRVARRNENGTSAPILRPAVSVPGFGDAMDSRLPLTDFVLLASTEKDRRSCMAAALNIACLSGAESLGQAPSAKLSCGWQMALPDIVAAIARADLVVVSRPIGGSVTKEDEEIADAVIIAGTPLFLVPQHDHGFEVEGTALIVWDGSLSAVAALRAAVPMLRSAGRVAILQPAGEAMPLPLHHALSYLSRCAIRVEQNCYQIDAAAGDAPLLDLFRALRADYVVMGGFGRWPSLKSMLYEPANSVFLKTSVPILFGN
jgi:hypothetical protein